jgi:predicted DsbA family dithiol-disulfide isomerase
MQRIRFHFDPRCPWCYQTSRWACRIEELGEVSIDWAVFSLEVVNLPEGEDPLAIEARSGPALRTSLVLRDRVGPKAVGDFYHALGKRIWETAPPMPVDDLDGIRDALQEIGANPSILDEALADRSTWDAVVEEHNEIVARTNAFGVPTIVLDGADGPAIFGPVIYKLPDDEESVELWRHTEWLVRNANFAEFKRGRGGLPDLPSIEWRMQQRAAAAAAAAEST